MSIKASEFLIVAINKSGKQITGGFETIKGKKIQGKEELTVEEAKAAIAQWGGQTDDQTAYSAQDRSDLGFLKA